MDQTGSLPAALHPVRIKPSRFPSVLVLWLVASVSQSQMLSSVKNAPNIFSPYVGDSLCLFHHFSL